MLLSLLPAIVLADPAARLEAFLKAHPSFVATFTAGSSERIIATGTLRAARPNRMRLDVKGNGFDYTALSTPTNLIDLDRVQKVYDERPPLGGMALYESRISGAQAFSPRFLLARSAAQAMGSREIKAVGDNELRATIATQMGPMEVRMVVAPSGQPTLYSTKGGGSTRQWRILSVTDGPADSPAFRVEAPLGYVPHALPELPYPLQAGQPAPLSGWWKGGAAIDLSQPRPGTPRLLAVLGEDCPASRAARPLLIELGRTLPVYLIEKGGIVDPTGKLMARLSPPGTPMFYLVGGDGKVKKLWFGFDPAQGKAWQTEVKEAAK